MVHSDASEPPRYSVIRLNDWSPTAWAVVDPTGAIATLDGRLLMRLTREEARELAGAMTAAGSSRADDL